MGFGAPVLIVERASLGTWGTPSSGIERCRINPSPTCFGPTRRSKLGRSGQAGASLSDFAITLYDAAGNALPRQRLSEGEKQIFAVAMLWGLARASARPLPAVIDTPMARLAATHRENLVERYFPNASHQVLVFSTDTEVDRHYYELLLPAVSRAYHLRYSEQERVTVGEEGYFWKE